MFLILIAVALFAALSYAITQSGRGNGTVEREAALVVASRVTQYPALLRNIVMRMLLGGTAVNTITFTHPPTGQAFEIFDPLGGGMVLEVAPSGLGGTATAWIFQPDTGAAGYYVKDIGANTSATGREVLAALHDISLVVCKEVNRGLGLPQTPAAVTTTTVWGAPLATYNTAAANTIAGAGLDGQAFACMATGGVYDYYHALAEQ